MICNYCRVKIRKCEIYTTWFYCHKCKKDYEVKMIYTAKNKNVIVEYIKPEEKKGILIVPGREADKHKGKVISVSDDFPFKLELWDVIIFDKYAGTLIDEEKGLYSVSHSGIICTVEEE